MKRVGWNHYFQKYESNGGTRENPQGPSNTTLQWFSFQKNNTVGTLYTETEYNIYLFFFQHFYATERKGFWCLLCPHTILLSYFKSFSIIHLELDIVTVGLRWKHQTLLLLSKTICHKKTYFTWFSNDCSNCPF